VHWSTYQGALFDMDGVLTETATVHRRAWRTTFDELFASIGGRHRAFSDDDYFRLVDGRARLDGVRAVLGDRGITLPPGDDADRAGDRSIHGVGARKHDLFVEILRRDGAAATPGSRRLLEHLASVGVRCAVVSASRSATEVLSAAGLQSFLDVVVDGNVASEMDLRGKPAPDTFIEAARRLGVAPSTCVAVEDALNGVEAARAAAVDFVVGVDGGAGAAALIARGADLVVRDLTELLADIERRA
jgi:beta-phosphoglucomutase family hydrolase